jgi:hypothetical protein
VAEVTRGEVDSTETKGIDVAQSAERDGRWIVGLPRHERTLEHDIHAHEIEILEYTGHTIGQQSTCSDKRFVRPPIAGLYIDCAACMYINVKSTPGTKTV